MDDPERFARILRTTGEILQDRITELEKQQMILDMKANLPKLKYDISWDEFFPYMFDVVTGIVFSLLYSLYYISPLFTRVLNDFLSISYFLFVFSIKRA